MIVGDEHAIEVHVGGQLRVIAHLAVRIADADAGRLHVGKQEGLPLTAAAQHADVVGGHRIGDPALGAGDAIAAVDLLGDGQHVAGRQVGAGLGFAGREAADELAAHQRWQVAHPQVATGAVQRLPDQNRLSVVQGRRQAARVVRQLFEHRHRCQRRKLQPQATDIGRERNLVQTSSAHRIEDRARKAVARLRCRVQRMRGRTQHIIGKLPHFAADAPRFVRQQQVIE